jgi:K+-transporting ATPase KdpC subunit
MPASTKNPAGPGLTAILIAQVRPACTVLVALALVTGVAYPLGMTAVSQVVFPRQAAGSPVRDASGGVRGSVLIGQSFSGPQWFHGRPSATGTIPYDPTASGGSNSATHIGHVGSTSMIVCSNAVWSVMHFFIAKAPIL